MLPEVTCVVETGSAKNDAYRWLIDQYVQTGRANARKMGYYLDSYWLTAWRAGSPELHTLTNQDYVIAHGGVLFDLDVWDDESPVDEPGQPPGTDAETLRRLLRAAYDQVHGEETIHVAGFVPWAYKYTNWTGNGCAAGGKHDPVPTEWRYAEILSCYNAYMDADAIGLSAMANASFYQHYPLRERYPQHRPTTEELTARGILGADGRIVPRHYVAHYVGDYDAAAWLYHQLPRMWSDPARGSAPLSWAFNPNLAERFPLGMAWARERATANDVFVAGDSGAGYLNPGYLTEPRPHSGLPSGLPAWERHCTRFYRQWDLSVTGFVIDGYARGLDQAGLDAYARFSPDGIVAQKIGRSGVHAGMPTLRMSGDLPHDAAAAAAAIARQCSGPAPTFHVWRSILMPPSWYAEVSRELDRQAGESIRVVDMVTLLRLIKEYHSHPEVYRPEDSRYAALRELVGRPDLAADLWPVWVNDGPFSVDEQAGARCWKLPAHQPPYYLYFAVHDAFYRAGRGPLTLAVEYLDSGGGRFGLQYDSTDAAAPHEGAYKDAPETVTRANTGQWRTARWTLADARLDNRQNGDADFRLFNPGGDLYVRAVRLRKGGG
ncbi:MAG: hypothetical protein HYU66_22815 [Armatimonadetes bacterium]|nr:hypothetical protein [Armatimonadota bacterium]